MRFLLLIGALIGIPWLFFEGYKKAGYFALGAIMMLIVVWQYESTRFNMTHDDCARWEQIDQGDYVINECAWYPPNGKHPHPLRVIVNTPINFVIGKTPI